MWRFSANGSWIFRAVSSLTSTPRHLTTSLETCFAALDAERFQRCFIAWVEAVHEARAGVVAIDGKTLRRSFGRADGRAAIPELLDLLRLNGAIVTIDAMGCQKEIAAKIVERGAD